MLKKQTKLLSLFMALVMLISFMVAGQIPASAIEITTDNSLMYQEYVKYYLQANENYTPVFTGYKTLLDVDTNVPTAYCFEFNNGYIIIDISAMSVYEYSLSTPSPYLGFNSAQLYYNGPIAYYFKASSDYVHTYAELDEEGNFTYTIPVNEMTSVISGDENLTDSQKAEKLLSMKSVYETNATTILAERYLSGSLTTAWLDGYCGPTAAHCMLRYLGFTDRNIASTDVIRIISTYTGQAVTISSMTNGMNNYLSDHNYNATVDWCYYDFSRVMTEINSNTPLTLGTNDGGIAPGGGHVQTIHGYKKTTDGTYTNYYLYINNSWGSNNVVLTYEGSKPTYLQDHVYY